MSDNNEWKTLESTYVVNDRWLKVRADTKQSPEGKSISPWYVIDGDLLEVAKVYAMAAEVDMTHPLRAVVLLTKVRGGTNEETEAREFLEELRLPVLKTVVPLRRDLGRMRVAPVDLAEYEDVLTELMED